MTFVIEMPKVVSCAASGCAYNDAGTCRARAITIGDGLHPRCHTYVESPSVPGGASDGAGVGACRVTACRYNRRFQCLASSIELLLDEDHADCEAFAWA